MALTGDRQNIFQGTVISHRGKTITDIGQSQKYRTFVNSLQNPETARVAVITNDLEGRPDLIAYAAYGNELLWWVVVEANNAYDYEVDLKAGKQIILPLL
tara:strand:- start:1056 stop:1355 length:300 start_codon:yes stop_codon:yes gene_type:complete